MCVQVCLCVCVRLCNVDVCFRACVVEIERAPVFLCMCGGCDCVSC